MLLERSAACGRRGSRRGQDSDERCRSRSRSPRHTLNTSCSIGISIYPDDAGDERALDEECRHRDVPRQGAGPQQLPVLLAGDEHACGRAAELETALRHAIWSDRSSCCTTSRKSTSAAGASSAWKHYPLAASGVGSVPPDQFIPLAEETGLIDRWASGRCSPPAGRCANGQAAGLPRAQNRGEHFGAPTAASRANSRTKCSASSRQPRLDPALVELEMTESLLLQNADENISVLNELGQRQIRIAVDDFGTGYSSPQLPQATADRYAQDRPLLHAQSARRQRRSRDRARDRRDGTQPRACASRPKASKPKSSSRYLRRMRCDEYQGFLFSRPLPAEKMLALLRAQPIARRSRQRAVNSSEWFRQ